MWKRTADADMLTGTITITKRKTTIKNQINNEKTIPIIAITL